MFNIAAVGVSLLTVFIPLLLGSQVVVFGGNGFVGQSVCQAALRLGAEVVSISRSGAPIGEDKKSWADAVRWVRGDIFKPGNYAPEVWGAYDATSYRVLVLRYRRTSLLQPSKHTTLTQNIWIVWIRYLYANCPYIWGQSCTYTTYTWTG